MCSVQTGDEGFRGRLDPSGSGIVLRNLHFGFGRESQPGAGGIAQHNVDVLIAFQNRIVND